MKQIVGGIVLLAVVVIGAWFFITQTRGNDTNNSDTDTLKVAATIFPIYDIVRTVAGDDLEVILITPPEASPHYFEPTPSLLKQLQGTKRIYQVGLGLDLYTEDIVANVVDAQARRVSDMIDYDFEHVGETDGHEDEQQHEHESVNPHYWLNPSIADAIASAVAADLADLDPEHADAYEQRAIDFQNQLAAADAGWTRAIVSLDNRNIITFHDSFSYFAQYFDLNVVAAIEPFPGKEPTPQYLRELEQVIEDYNVSALYVEPQLPKRVIEQFAADHGIKLGVLDPIGGVEGRSSYIDLIAYNVDTILATQSQ